MNFHVSPGKWLLLKGYSGAGKTTLLKTLSHCWPWFKGDISSPADSWYVSQTPLIKTGLLKEIICKALPLPVDDKSLSEVLHQVGLGKLAARIHDHDRWGDILSSGEKQRIALARLILRRPKWIFLDETTSHLEEQEAIRLLRLVREKLPTSGVIMVTHQPGVWNLADDICDRTLLGQYELFFYNGGDKSGVWKPETMSRKVAETAGEVLSPTASGMGILSGSLSGGQVTEVYLGGYRLATDEEGSVFSRQICEAMKASLGTYGIQQLSQKLRGEQETVKRQEDGQSGYEEEEVLKQYEESKQPEEGTEKTEGEGESGNGTPSEPDQKIMLNYQ